MAHVSKRGSTTRASGATLVASTLFAKKPPSTEVTTGDTMDTDSIDIQPLGLFRTVWARLSLSTTVWFPIEILMIICTRMRIGPLSIFCLARLRTVQDLVVC